MEAIFKILAIYSHWGKVDYIKNIGINHHLTVG